MASASADEIDDFQSIALTHNRVVERLAPKNARVVLHGNTARINLELSEQIGDRQGSLEFVRFAVECN